MEAGDVRPCSVPSPLEFVSFTQKLVPLGEKVLILLAETVPTNLIDNALRYSTSGAAIVISAEVVREQLRVTVFNEGSHIPAKELELVFEKFYRLGAAPGGTGLGLSIARAIVEAHAGRIWAENVGRRGVAFTFIVPSPTRHALTAEAADPAVPSVA